MTSDGARKQRGDFNIITRLLKDHPACLGPAGLCGMGVFREEWLFGSLRAHGTSALASGH